MLHKYLFVMGYLIKSPRFLRCYNQVKSYEFATFENLKTYQEERLRDIIHHSYRNVPYYHRLLNNLNLKPENIKTLEDLEKLPILTKEIIKTNMKEFIPTNLKYHKYVNRSTGGSTGHPFQYRLSVEDEILGYAILNANSGYAGYNLGDKIGIIAGSSLIPSTKSDIVEKLKSFVLNERRYSSFDLDNSYMNNIFLNLDKFKPKFVRGYASSVYIFAKYIKEYNLSLNFHPKAIFTTAEVLFDQQRRVIQEAFGCPVFNQYGLNDGGVTAFECEEHDGLHIDMIRSIMEISDSDGIPSEPKEEGRILATSLYNYAMPFIRYDTGDLGVLSDEKCACERETPLLDRLVGRVSDFIYTPEGLQVHGEFFSHIFWELNWVKQYQIVQKRIDELIIMIVPDEIHKINETDLEWMRRTILNRMDTMNLVIEIVDAIDTTSSGKWKYILSEVH